MLQTGEAVLAIPSCDPLSRYPRLIWSGTSELGILLAMPTTPDLVAQIKALESSVRPNSLIYLWPPC